MAKEERVKENGGRGLPLSLQSLQGGSTVDTGKLKINWTSKFFYSIRFKVSLRNQAVHVKRKELKAIVSKVGFK